MAGRKAGILEWAPRVFNKKKKRTKVDLIECFEREILKRKPRLLCVENFVEENKFCLFKYSPLVAINIG